MANVAATNDVLALTTMVAESEDGDMFWLLAWPRAYADRQRIHRKAGYGRNVWPGCRVAICQ